MFVFQCPRPLVHCKAHKAMLGFRSDGTPFPPAVVFDLRRFSSICAVVVCKLPECGDYDCCGRILVHEDRIASYSTEYGTKSRFIITS